MDPTNMVLMFGPVTPRPEPTVHYLSKKRTEVMKSEQSRKIMDYPAIF